MRDYSQKLAKYDGKGDLIRSGISLRLSGAGSGVAEKWWFWLWPAGGTFEEKTPGGKYHSGYNNQAGRDALKLYIDLLYKYGVDNYKIKHDAESFALEKTAMFTRESWVVGYMKEHAPQVNYDVAVLPKYRRWGTLTEIKNLYVSKQCKNPDIAWGLVMYMQKPENLKFLLEKVGWFPTRADVDFEDVFNKIPQYRGFLSRPEGFELYMYHPIACGDEILTKLAERLVTAFTRKDLLDNPKGIAKVIEEAARQTDEILKEAGLYGVD
ncbi:extracellular solute-binding protein [Patescibacteria group bacterium]|nr:extracellular solute-binding protein [Patescibacteria group bacterium]